jgi:hypothetical protein
MGSGAKSSMRKGFLIYEEIRQYLVTYEEAVSHRRLCIRSRLNFLVNEENLILFLSVYHLPLYCHQVHPLVLPSLFIPQPSLDHYRQAYAMRSFIHLPPVLHPYSPPPLCCHPCVHLSPSPLYCHPCSSLPCPLTLASFAGNALICTSISQGFHFSPEAEFMNIHFR